MPDMRVLDMGGGFTIEMPIFDDSVSGVMALAQTAALMLMDPNYGNLEYLLKKRINRAEIGEIILRSVDNVERLMLEEQMEGVLPDEEMLSSLDIKSVVIDKSSITLSLRVLNILNSEGIITI